MFAPLAKEMGWEAWVIDGSAYAVDILTSRYGLRGAPADLNAPDAIPSALGLDCSFDVINSFHVIEHLKTPKQYLVGCRNALVTGGVLRLGLPFYPRRRIFVHELAYRMKIAHHPFNFGLPDHVSYFDERTICALLQEVGFDVLEVARGGYVSWENVIDKASESGNWLRRMLRSTSLALGPALKRVGIYRHLDILARKRI